MYIVLFLIVFFVFQSFVLIFFAISATWLDDFQMVFKWPKPLATKLVKKTCNKVNANRSYINANGKWPNFIMKDCQNV